MIKKTALLLLLSSTAAMAADNEIRFNHLGVDYLYSDINGNDGDGFGANLSVALTNYLFVDVDYSSRSIDLSGGGSADIELFSGGIGGNYALNEDKSIQLFGVVSWEQLSVDGQSGSPADPGSDPGPDDENGGFLCDPFFGSGLCLTAPSTANEARAKAAVEYAGTADDTIDGYGVKAGVRAMVWNNLGVEGVIGMRDYSDTDDNFYGIGVTYGFGDWVAVLNYEVFDELEDISLGVRYTFGKESENAGLW